MERFFKGYYGQRRRSNKDRETHKALLLRDDDLLAARDTTRTTGGNETDLLTRRSVPPDGRGVTDVLVVTTTVRMVHRIHGHTTDTRPAVLLGLVLEVGTTSFEDGLVDPATTGNNAHHGARVGGDGLLGTRRKLDSGDTLVGVVRDEGGVVARGTGEGAAITRPGLDIANDGTLGHLAYGENVADRELGCRDKKKYGQPAIFIG